MPRILTPLLFSGYNSESPIRVRTMAKKKDSEKHEDGQKGKYNKDDVDAAELENFVDDITDEGNAFL